MNTEIVVLGSLNTDLVVTTDRIPQPGETLSGHNFMAVQGGKGANQSVAAALAGGRVAMIGCVGTDDYGKRLRTSLEEYGIDISHITISSHSPTGIAMIIVERSGENRILVVPGANGDLSVKDIDNADGLLSKAAILILQMEIPWNVSLYALEKARSKGIPTLLNLAPAYPMPQEVLRKVEYLILNESEIQILTKQNVDDISSAKQATATLLQRGSRVVILTLGSQGALLANGEGMQYFPPYHIDVVDTTAAGDAFVGNFATSLVNTGNLIESMELANAAGALAVTKTGAQVSLPSLNEVKTLAATRIGQPPRK